MKRIRVESLEYLSLANVASHMDWESTQKLLLLLNAQNNRYLLTHTIAELKKLTNCPIVLKWMDEITRIDVRRDRVLPYIIDPDIDMDSIAEDTITFTYDRDTILEVTQHKGRNGRNSRFKLIFGWNIPIKEIESFLTLDILNEIFKLHYTYTYPLEDAWADMGCKQLRYISDPFTTIFKE
jgi:hypothetical protein